MILNFFVSFNSEHYIMICSNRVVPDQHYHCGWHNLLKTPSLDNILSAGDPAEGYALSTIAGPPTNHTTTVHAMARLVSITGMIRWMTWWKSSTFRVHRRQLDLLLSFNDICTVVSIKVMCMNACIISKYSRLAHKHNNLLYDIQKNVCGGEPTHSHVKKAVIECVCQTYF